jgi:hypothetical protein
MDSQEPTSGENQPRIVRGRVDSFALYEITENELETLERGSPSSLYLNFGIFLLSIGVAFFTSLVTTNLEGKVFVVFTLLTLLGLLGGLFLMLLWFQTRRSISEVAKTIRRRIPSERLRSDVNEQG